MIPGNVNDRRRIKALLRGQLGKVFADRGYVSHQLAEELKQSYGITFIAKPHRNMKNYLMSLSDKRFARQRALVKTVIDQLKNISQIEHSRHRSPANFCVNLLCGLITYCHQPKKPSIALS